MMIESWSLNWWFYFFDWVVSLEGLVVVKCGKKNKYNDERQIV